MLSGKRIGAKPRCQQTSYKTTPTAKKQFAFPVPKAGRLSPHPAGHLLPLPFLASASTTSVKLRITQEKKTKTT